MFFCVRPLPLQNNYTDIFIHIAVDVTFIGVPLRPLTKSGRDPKEDGFKTRRLHWETMVRLGLSGLYGFLLWRSIGQRPAESRQISVVLNTYTRNVNVNPLCLWSSRLIQYNYPL